MNKQLTRSVTDKYLGGVCGGVAEYLGWDSTVIRLIAIVLLIVGFGTAAIVYLVLWLVMPQGPQSTPVVPSGPSHPDH